MPDRGRRQLLSEACGIALVVGLVAAAAVTIRLVFLEEPLSQRGVALGGLAGAGGAAAALATAGLCLILAPRVGAWFRALAGGALAGALFVPATMFFFAIRIRVIDGRVEADTVTDLGAGDLLWSLFGAMGMFTPTGLRYLLPWPALAVAAAAAILMYQWPRESRPVPRRDP